MKEKKAITAIALIVLASAFAYPFSADLIAGEKFTTEPIQPVENEHCRIIDLSGDRMLYQTGNNIYLSDLSGLERTDIGYYVSFYPVLNRGGDKFVAFESTSSKLRIYGMASEPHKYVAADEMLQDSKIRGLSWSPDGTRLALVLSNRSVPYALFIYDLETSKSIHIFNSSEKFYEPSWSPDGKYISFMAPDGRQRSTNGLYIANLHDSTVSIAVTDIGDARSYWPERSDWNPSGDRIAYSSFGDIILCDPDGGNLFRVACCEKSRCSHLEWSPSGRDILYHFISSESPRLAHIGILHANDGTLDEIFVASFQNSYLLSWAGEDTKVTYLMENIGYDNGFVVDLERPSTSRPSIIISYILFFVLPACCIAGWYFMSGDKRQ